MSRLRSVFESLGFRDVQTILASGNVIFDSPSGSTSSLGRKISEGLKKALRTEVYILLHSAEDIRRLVNANPFKNIKVLPQTRFYVTFLSEKPQSKLKIPHEFFEGDFKIIRVSAAEVCSVLTLSAGRGTVDVMAILEKEYGKKVTTRNWNTIMRIVKAGQ